jgi:ferritin
MDPSDLERGNQYNNMNQEIREEDLNKLHAHLYQRAIEEGKKPESISSYLRITIKNIIDSFEKNKILSNE